MADNRTEIAITTAEAIRDIIYSATNKARGDGGSSDGLVAGLDRALEITETYISAAHALQGPRVGRPRKSAAKAE
jgi:hypothetical protein